MIFGLEFDADLKVKIFFEVLMLNIIMSPHVVETKTLLAYVGGCNRLL